MAVISGLPESEDEISGDFSGFSSDESISGTQEQQQQQLGGPPFEKRFYIKTALDQLASISTSIRRSGTKYRHEKADQTLREEDFEDLKSFLTFLIIRQFQPDSKHKTVCERQAQVGTLGGQHQLTLVQRRLIYHNIVRRNRILFARHNIVREVAPPQLQHMPKPPPFQPRTIEATEGVTPTAQPTNPPELTYSVITPSVVHTATEIGSDLDMREVKDLVKEKTPSVMTKVTKIGAAQDYPACPKWTMGANGKVQCPYCADILTDEYSTNTSRWR